MDLERLVFIDETGAATNMTRRYGRAPKGCRCVDSAPLGDWQTTTFVAALRHHECYNNTGTLTGGITVGQGESPDALLVGNGGDPLAPTGGFDQQPWTCVRNARNADGSQNPNPAGFSTNDELPFCYNVFVNVHQNFVTQNSSIGDEVFSGTPAGAGGVTFCSGSEYYKFNYNWVCGNLSSGDERPGSPRIQLQRRYRAQLDPLQPEHEPDHSNQRRWDRRHGRRPGRDSNSRQCGDARVRQRDRRRLRSGPQRRTGPGMVINANLIMGNGAESGSGGGIRFQDVDGAELAFFPNGNASTTRGEVALAVNFINNTVGLRDEIQARSKARLQWRNFASFELENSIVERN